MHLHSPQMVTLTKLFLIVSYMNSNNRVCEMQLNTRLIFCEKIDLRLNPK